MLKDVEFQRPVRRSVWQFVREDRPEHVGHAEASGGRRAERVARIVAAERTFSVQPSRPAVRADEDGWDIDAWGAVPENEAATDLRCLHPDIYPWMDSLGGLLEPFGRPQRARNLVRRFTSRLERLDHAFLRERLRGARQYDRIAGYFRSSIFEVAAEELASVGRIRIVCNSDLNPQDIHASQEARTRALMQRWREGSSEAGVAVDTLLHRNRYIALRDLLQARDANGKAKVEVKVVDRFTAPLVHGKAGIITLADGSKTCFMGSVNETREAWQDHYELLWEDPSPEAIEWTQAEFDFLWKKSLPLPDAVITEIARCAERIEIRMPDCPPWDEKGDTDLPRAALAEAPLVRAGDGLQPWQKAFISEFLRQREIHGKARLLLADEVGVGKTLSMATAALLTVLLGDGPALILAPATLCEQWQTELIEKLGIPSARWISNRKEWMDHRGHVIPSRPEDITRCPYRVAIVSTGLVMRDSVEKRALLDKRARPEESPYGIVVLDEAHKARGSATNGGEREPNKLLAFIGLLALKARHVILGTATPIQTDPMDLWDLITILGAGQTMSSATTCRDGGIGRTRPCV